MQKLMREMENWRQSMIKAAGYMPESVQLRTGTGRYAPPQGPDYDTDLPLGPSVSIPTAPVSEVDPFDLGSTPMSPPDNFETTPVPVSSPGSAGTPGLEIVSTPSTPMGAATPFTGDRVLPDPVVDKRLPNIIFTPGAGNVGTVPATVNGHENPVVRNNTVERTSNVSQSTLDRGHHSAPRNPAESIPEGSTHVSDPGAYGLDPNGDYSIQKVTGPDGRVGYNIYSTTTGNMVQSVSPAEATADQANRAEPANTRAETRAYNQKLQNQSLQPGESLITKGPNKGVITKGSDPQTPVAKNVNGERQELTKEDLDNFIQNEFQEEAENLGMSSETALPAHGFIPNPIPSEAPVAPANSTNWRGIGMGAGIGAGAGGLLGGGLGYALGGKGNKTLSTLLGAGLGIGAGGLLGGISGNYLGNKSN